MRPKTLADVARLTLSGESFDRCFSNFLDEFYAAPKAEHLAEMPPLLAPQTGRPGEVQDAYLAAAAEELARAHQLAIPPWTVAEERKLHRPWFASSLEALRGILIVESPATFRARNLFISENALTRA